MHIEFYRRWLWPQCGVLATAAGAWTFIDIGPAQIRFPHPDFIRKRGE